MKKVVARAPTCSAVSNRVLLISMTTKSARETTSVLTSRASSSFPVSDTAARNSERTSSSEKSEISSSVRSGPDSCSSRSPRSDARASEILGRSALCPISSSTSGRAKAALSCRAASLSVKRTRRSLVTSSLRSTPLNSSPLLETTIELIYPCLPKSSWALFKCSMRVGSAPTGPLPDTTPLTVRITGSPLT